jgi:hypothetical protein
MFNHHPGYRRLFPASKVETEIEKVHRLDMINNINTTAELNTITADEFSVFSKFI